MSDTIDAVAVQTFENTVRYLAQQGVNRLRPFVQEVSVVGEGHNFDRVAATTAQRRTARLANTPDNNTAFSRRKAIPVEYDTGDSTRKKDITQMLFDPKSVFARSQAMAMKRAHDDEIIAAAVGDSRDGDGNVVALPASQFIDESSTSINFDIVTFVSEKFMDQDIDPDTPRVFVISPRQARKLLQLTEVSSKDYNSAKILEEKGYVESWMGYMWIVSTRLQSPTGDGSDVSCFAMTMDAIGLQISQEIQTEVAKDPGKSFDWRIYTNSIFGAIRVEDEQLVRIDLSQTL